MFPRQDRHALVLTVVASDGRQKYLAGVRYKRDTPVVAAFCPILFCVDYSTMVIAYFHWCGTSSPPTNTNDDIEQSPPQGVITVEDDLEQLNGDSVRSDSLSVR